jgi:hypothetical protein
MGITSIGGEAGCPLVQSDRVYRVDRNVELVEMLMLVVPNPRLLIVKYYHVKHSNPKRAQLEPADSRGEEDGVLMMNQRSGGRGIIIG